MKHATKKIAVLILAATLSASALAGFDEGLAAAQKGDFATAYKEWRAAAEKGDVNAQENLAMMYGRGDGVKKDAREVVVWLTKAADQGSANAQHKLGVFYLYGWEGISNDPKKALQFLTKAAGQQYADSQYLLGMLVKDGSKEAMLPRDSALAYSQLSMAANNGHGGAQYQLGVMSRDGEGTTKDPVEALKWFIAANFSGEENASAAMKSINATLSQAQNREGMARHMSWCRMYKTCPKM